MSTSNNNKRPSSPTKPSEPPAKKAANNGSSPSTIDIHLDETFGVKPDVLYDALVDGKKYAEAVGMKGWEGMFCIMVMDVLCYEWPLQMCKICVFWM